MLMIYSGGIKGKIYALTQPSAFCSHDLITFMIGLFSSKNSISILMMQVIYLGLII
jgi:hypothetical protein